MLMQHVKRLMIEQVREAIKGGEVYDLNSFNNYVKAMQGDPVSYINGLIYYKDLNNWVKCYPHDFINVYFELIKPADGERVNDLASLVVNVVTLVVNLINLDYNDFSENFRRV